MFLLFGTCFGFLEVFLDSGKCFRILGSVLDSGTCVVLLEVQKSAHISATDH